MLLFPRLTAHDHLLPSRSSLTGRYYAASVALYAHCIIPGFTTPLSVMGKTAEKHSILRTEENLKSTPKLSPRDTLYIRL
jgi:hypothetical protein